MKIAEYFKINGVFWTEEIMKFLPHSTEKT